MAIDEYGLRAALKAQSDRMATIERFLGIYVRDEELDGPRGDPSVRFPPRSWRGENFLQKRYSQCSPEFLDMLAESLQWSVDNPPSDPEKLEKHRKYAAGNKKDAALARTWARRLRVREALAEVEEAKARAAALATESLFGSDDDAKADEPEDPEQAAKDAAMPLEGGPDDSPSDSGNESLFDDDGDEEGDGDDLFAD
jgi:hypothetical protein